MFFVFWGLFILNVLLYAIFYQQFNIKGCYAVFRLAKGVFNCDIVVFASALGISAYFIRPYADF